MNFTEPIRIISDLHLGFPSGKVTRPAQVAPLFQGPATVIFNGDTVETHFAARREQGLRDADALRALCEKAGARPVFLNGNHDPGISSLDHADLAGGAVLVTHGDILYHDIVPWDQDMAVVVGKIHTEHLATLDEDALADFETRLHASKRAILALELHDVRFSPGAFARLALLMDTVWPPWKPFQIMKCWAGAPGRAVRLAETFRPCAQIIVIGHTHRGGIWRIGPRIVINTGSFVPFAKRFVVDVGAGAVSMKTVLYKNGAFFAGRETARFHAAKL